MNRVADLQRQLASAQEITHIGSWEWDIATGLVSWSDELYRIYGLEPRSLEITVDFFMSRIHPDDRARLQREVGAAIERGGRFQWVERVVRPDGSVRTLDTVGEACRNGDGRVAGLIGTCRDVTEERERNEQVRLYADIVHNVQIGLSVWAVPEDGGPPVLLAFNPASERIARMPLAPFVGKGLDAIAPYASGGIVEPILARVAADRGVHESGVERSKNPSDPTRALTIKGFPLPGGRVGLAIEDVTVQTLERRLQQGEQRVLEMIAAGAPLADSLAALIRIVEEHSPPMMGSVLLVSADGSHVVHGAGPSLPPDYMRGIDGSPIGPRAGSCGTAAFFKRAVIVTDIQTDPLWDDYRALALAHGLRACWSTPILTADDRVLGTFAFYYRVVLAPAPGDVAIIERAARVAGIAIERKQLEEQLRELSAHVEAALEDERAGIAREIHDEIGQSLTALKMDVAWIARRAANGVEPVPREALLEKLDAMSALTDRVIGQIRRISSELRPGVLDDLGLVAAIEWQAQDFETRSAITCTLRASGSDAAIGRRESTAVFRVFQEALTNVSRHARAERVDVRIDVSPELLSLEVRDDGVGITPDAARNPKSLGLLGMRERAHRLGGTVTVGAVEPTGTRVTLVVPIGKDGGRR
jgi:PAS domain S-box-containing protein